MSTRPNILFLMSDEHRADVVGYEGNEIIRSRTMDWLASSGIVFRNAYTPAPVCIPGRQSLMAGQLPSTSGCTNFGQDLPPFSMTWAKRFAQFAYQTVCSGKLHHVGPDQMQGWTKRIAPDAEIANGFIDGLREAEFIHYNQQKEEGTGKWSNNKEIRRAGIGEGRYQQFDQRATRDACQFIRDHFIDPMYDRPGNWRPLLLKLSLLQPHYPFFTDRQRFEYYFNRVPIHHGETRFDHPVLRKTQAGPDVDAPQRDIRRATAAYYGMVETVDDHIAEVLDTLRDVGEDLDEWIIVYTSDHGDMLGEHGIWEKCQMFEASARVPLIIRWPKRFKPGVVEENVNLCDLFATLCDLADIPLPESAETVQGAGLDSRSLVPLMEGRTDDWHQRYHNETISQFREGRLMIKRDNLKYIWFEDAPEVLFDLQQDPGEMRNAIDDDAYSEAVATFRQRRQALGFGEGGDPEAVNAGY